jgi:hypothetical protein
VPTTTTTSTSTTTEASTTTTLAAAALCADPTGDEDVTATDALFVLRAAVGGTGCEPCVCDVNDSGSLTASDSLIVLRFAVGAGDDLQCPSCDDDLSS